MRKGLVSGPLNLIYVISWSQAFALSHATCPPLRDGLVKHAEAMVSDEDFAARATRFPLNPPITKVGLCTLESS